jgi:uncharacterized protein YndB with AHSA1/START domain
MAKIELEAFYPYPIAHVWEALIQPESLAQWLMKNEGFEPVVGRKFQFRAEPVFGWKGIAYCEVLAVEKPYKLSWSQQGDEDSPERFIITWTLKEEGGGTRLSLVHDGLEGLRGLMLKRFMGSGWKRMFKDRIPMVLDYAQQHGWQDFPKDRRLLSSDCHPDA